MSIDTIDRPVVPVDPTAEDDAGGIAVVTGSAEVRADRFRATLAAVAGFTGKDDGRPILTGVQVEYHPGAAHQYGCANHERFTAGVEGNVARCNCENDPATGGDGYLTMVATDSHRLAVFPVPADITGAPEPVLLGRDTVAAILALVKPGIIGRNPGPVTLQISELGGYRFNNGAGGETTGQGIDGEFPNYRGLVPEFHKSGGAVAFNPGYLEAMGKAFRVLLAGAGSPVRVSTDPHTAERPALPGGFTGRPVLFTVGDSDLWPDPVPNPVAVLMPVRIS